MPKKSATAHGDKFKDFDLSAAKDAFAEAQETRDNAAHDLGEYLSHIGAVAEIGGVKWSPAKVKGSEDRYTLRKLGDRETV